MDLINVESLCKSYGKSFSLKNINLKVEEGKIFALLGLNGAGKTTLVKLILNLLNAESGNIFVNGINAIEPHSRIGVAFLPEKFSFFPFYTVYGALEFIAKMKSIPETNLGSEIEQALSELNIQDLKDRKIKTLSKGQVQRIGLASLLLGDNKLLVLDEPFSGLDPIGIRDLKEILKKEKARGKTIFINSHILSEMEKICDEVAIIHKGELLAQKDIKTIIEKDGGLENFFASIVSQ